MKNDFVLPFGKAKIERTGKDLTIVTLSRNVGLSLQDVVHHASGIPLNVLSGAISLHSLEAEVKRRWMKGRTTTRPEDAAYCLLGICGCWWIAVVSRHRLSLTSKLIKIDSRYSPASSLVYLSTLFGTLLCQTKLVSTHTNSTSASPSPMCLLTSH